MSLNVKYLHSHNPYTDECILSNTLGCYWPNCSIKARWHVSLFFETKVAYQVYNIYIKSNIYLKDKDHFDIDNCQNKEAGRYITFAEVFWSQVKLKLVSVDKKQRPYLMHLCTCAWFTNTSMPLLIALLPYVPCRVIFFIYYLWFRWWRTWNFILMRFWMSRYNLR